MTTRLDGAVAALVCTGVLAACGATARASDAEPVLTAAPLTLSAAAVYAAEPAPATEKPALSLASDVDSAPLYGQPGGWWLTLGSGVAHNFKKDLDVNGHIGFSTFIAKDLEFDVELAGWYFAQEGRDTGGFNPNMVFRWHFWHDEAYDWTVYGDAGIGLLFAGDDVPQGGTSFDFTPRLGVGFTHRLGEGSTRLQIGLRYHHISNARIQGDDENPGRDSLMFYVGVIFPL